MKKPRNIYKIDGFDLFINTEHYKILECAAHLNNPPNLTLLWLVPQSANTSSLLLFTLHWDNETYDIKYVIEGEGVTGQQLDAGLISRYNVNTMMNFINFFSTQVTQYVHCLKD